MRHTLARAVRKMACALTRGQKDGTPIRFGRAVVVSSLIGQTVVTPDGGSTNVTVFNYNHTKSLSASTVVDVLWVGHAGYIIGYYP